MTEAKLRTGRFLAVAILAVALALGAGATSGECQTKDWLDCYEDYIDSDLLRETWELIPPPGTSASLDLECDSFKSCPNPWCDVHNTEGSAFEGCQYMRINYLTGTVIGRMVVNEQDWSDLDFVSFFYRGRSYFFNYAADIQLCLEGYNGAETLCGPLLVGETECGILGQGEECPWKKYSMYIGDWPGRFNVTQVDIVIEDAQTGGGRLYIDCVHRHVDPTPVDKTTWGRIKSLYR